MRLYKLPVSTKLINRMERLDEVGSDISTVIIRLRIIRNELNAEIESLDNRIEELKRTQEIVRGMKGNDEQYV